MSDGWKSTSGTAKRSLFILSNCDGKISRDVSLIKPGVQVFHARNSLCMSITCMSNANRAEYTNRALWGGYPCPQSEFQSLVCRPFGRFPCRCRNIRQDVNRLSPFRCSHVSRPCRLLEFTPYRALLILWKCQKYRSCIGNSCLQISSQRSYGTVSTHD